MHVPTLEAVVQVADLSDIFTGRLLNEIPLAIASFADAFLYAMLHFFCRHLFNPSTLLHVHRATHRRPLQHLSVLDLSDNAFGSVGVRAVSPLLSRSYGLRARWLTGVALMGRHC